MNSDNPRIGDRTPDTAEIKRKSVLGFLKGEVTTVPDELLFSMSDVEADRFVNGEY